MIDAERAWRIIANRPEFASKRFEDYGYQAPSLRVSLAATVGQLASNQPMNFPNGALIIGLTASAHPTGLAATTVYRPGLDLFAARIDLLQNRNIAGSSVRAIGSSLFGTGQWAQMPVWPLVIPTQGGLVYEVENLTSTAIEVCFTHHCLVPIAIG